MAKKKAKRKASTVEHLTSFEGALPCLREGRAITRKGWNGKGMFLALLITSVTLWQSFPPGRKNLMLNLVSGICFNEIKAKTMTKAEILAELERVLT